MDYSIYTNRKTASVSETGVASDKVVFTATKDCVVYSKLTLAKTDTLNTKRAVLHVGDIDDLSTPGNSVTDRILAEVRGVIASVSITQQSPVYMAKNETLKYTGTAGSSQINATLYIMEID